MLALNQAVHINAGQVDTVGIKAPVGTISSTSATQTLPHIAAGGLKLRAVLRNTRLPVASAFQALTMRQIGDDAALQDVGFAVEVLVLLAFGDHRADAGLGVKAGNTAAAGTHPFGQSALRIEFQLELAATDTGA